MSAGRQQEEGAIPRRWRISSALVVVLSFIITGVVLEGASRLFYFVHWGGHLYGVQHNEYSLRLGWQLAPGTYRFFQINSQRFRRPDDIPLVPAKNTIRILLVGGSTAFGSNGLYRSVEPKPLLYEDTIDYKLQTLLSERHQDLRFEVINAAVPEYRLFQEITLFREKLINFHPHLVIFLDGHNDISAVTEGSALTLESNPYWTNRHFLRGQHALNDVGIIGPLYYLDIYLGRSSYLYYGLTVLHQRFHEAMVSQGLVFSVNAKNWGSEAFLVSNEKVLRDKYESKLRELDQVVPFYLELVHDLKAIADLRRVKIVYALQPEIVVEDSSDLSKKDQQIQEIAFEHQRDLGTVAWRYLAPRIAQSLSKLNDQSFHFVNLVTIGKYNPGELYTDYCHLTADGNRVVAEQLYPVIAAMLGLGSSHSGMDQVSETKLARL
jgi:hypothetical protein